MYTTRSSNIIDSPKVVEPQIIFRTLQVYCPEYSNQYPQLRRKYRLKTKVLKMRFLRDFNQMIPELNTYVHDFANKYGKGAFNDLLVGTMVKVMLDLATKINVQEPDHQDLILEKSTRKTMDNMDEAVGSHSSNDLEDKKIYRRQSHGNGKPAIKFQDVACEFLSSLHNITQECKNQNCTSQIDQLEEYRNLVVTSTRSNHDHDYLANAVQKFASQLESMENLEDDSMQEAGEFKLILTAIAAIMLFLVL